MRGRPRTVYGSAATVRIRRVPSHQQLSISGRLRGQRKTVSRDGVSPARLQDQVSGDFLHPPRQPRVRGNKSHLRLLRRVQTPLFHPPLEGLLRVFQHPPGQCGGRRQDTLHARRIEPGAVRPGPDTAPAQARGRSGRGTHVRSAVERSGSSGGGVGGERPRCQFHVWCGCCGGITGEVRSRPDCARPPSGGRRIRILCRTEACDALQCPKLLW
mmetsp:Transcript_40382/g.78995  ORF Transcript_40382/g.78995 Transcript_40382/m.78995 type:complete len:214 (+) Transcript_40382:706-1347(+)